MYCPKVNCQFQQPTNVKESLIPYTIIDHPWQCIATDLFDIDGHTYLLTVDRYSKYSLVDFMSAPVSSQGVTAKISILCPNWASG